MWGAFSGALAVAIGAFGQHWLEPIMTPMEVKNFNIASDYHFIHSLTLLFTGYYANRKQKSKPLMVAGYSFLFGIVFFCFSLYGYGAFDEGSWIVMLPPLGGVCLLLGWIALGMEFLLSKI